MKILVKLLCLLCLVNINLSVASNELLQFDSAQQEQRYHQLTEQLRCPQCQNNSIADSNANIAVDMRAKVLELLKQDQSEQEIIAYMVKRYGNFVTYDPPLTSVTLLLWVTPLALILFGIIWIARRKPKTADQNSIKFSSLTENEQARLQQLLQDKETR